VGALRRVGLRLGRGQDARAPLPRSTPAPEILEGFRGRTRVRAFSLFARRGAQGEGDQGVLLCTPRERLSAAQRSIADNENVLPEIHLSLDSPEPISFLICCNLSETERSHHV
jgi:hypothetical protein